MKKSRITYSLLVFVLASVLALTIASGGTFSFSSSNAAVLEPPTMLLLGISMVGLIGGVLRNRKFKKEKVDSWHFYISFFGIITIVAIWLAKLSRIIG